MTTIRAKDRQNMDLNLLFFKIPISILREVGERNEGAFRSPGFNEFQIYIRHSRRFSVPICLKRPPAFPAVA